MIALTVENGYGAHVTLTVIAHEGVAVADVTSGAGDVMLDVTALRELARIATIAADMLAVGS